MTRTMSFITKSCLALWLMQPGLLLAQRTSATLSGAVTDPAGAVVPRARVTAVASSTGSRLEAYSNDAGLYVIPNLSASTYRLEVDASGFQSLTHDGIVLTVGQNATVNLTLTIGAQTQRIEVQGDASQVNLRSQAIEQAVSPEMAKQLPLNGRNV